MKFIIKLTALIILIYGCGGPENPKDQRSETSQTEASVPHKEHENGTAEPLELNNGAKWQVVPEMMIYIRGMKSDVNEFSKTSHVDTSDYIQLAKRLQKNIDLLTGHCTMKGEAHDALHKWLVPYMSTVDKLNGSRNIAEEIKTVEEIDSSLKTFDLYFE